MPQVFDYVEAGDVGAAEGRDRLRPGDELLAGEELRTANGGRLIMQGDGNLVLYAPNGSPIWATDTQGKPATRAQFQKDGNLVVRSPRGYGAPEGTGYWDSNTWGRGVTSIVLQSDGNLVWYAGRRAITSTETAGWRKSPNWHKSGGNWFSHALHSVEHIASEVTAPVRFVAKEAKKGIAAAEKIPVLGTVVHGIVAGSGLGLVTNIASGARIDRAVVADFKDKLRAAKESAPLAQSIVSLMPGVGTGIAGALAFSAAIAEGHRIDDALIAGVRGSVPGGALGQVAFDTAARALHGENITHAALDAARAQIPREARAAFDLGVAIYHGRNLQHAAMRAAEVLAPSIVPSALSNVLPSGAASALARDFAHSISSGTGDTVKNIAWSIAHTGPAFIPGLHSAVSAGMANAAAIGRSEAAKSVRLAAARSSIASEARHGFDVGLGAVRGHLLSSDQLHSVREQLSGDKAKGAFDAAVMIATNAAPELAGRVSAGQSDSARRTFLRVLEVHRNGPAVPVHRATSPMRGRSRAVRVAVSVSPPEPTRAFPSLTGAQNKVAGAMIANENLRSMPAAGVARALAVDTRDARAAIAAFLQRFGATRELDYRDVGEMETFDQAARRHNVNAPNLGEWPGDTGEIHVVQMPPIPMDRRALHAIYRRGDSNIRRAMLAHELLAHVARNTGELEGTEWVIQGNGDWPSKVAQTVVGDGSRWREILPLNPSFHVMSNGNIPQWTPGRRVQLPPSWFPSAMPVAAAPTVSANMPSSSGGPPFASAYPLGYPSSVYVNRAGDDGEKIAALITGDKNRWRELLAVNPKLESAKYGIAIYEGKSIRLPSSWVRAQPSPAVVVASQTPETVTAIEPGGIRGAPGSVPGVPVEASPPVAAPPATDGRIGSPVAKTGPVLAPVSEPTSSAAPTTTPATDAGPVVTGSAEQIATVQIMLGAFFRDHPDASYSIPSSPYGSQPEDFAGVWTDRTTAAMLGFERWWNGKRNTPALEADGMPSGDAVQALMNQTAADGGAVDARQPIQLTVGGQEQRAATAPAKKGPGLAIPIALVLAALGAG